MRTKSRCAGPRRQEDSLCRARSEIITQRCCVPRLRIKMSDRFLAAVHFLLLNFAVALRSENIWRPVAGDGKDN
jgi:hypothetical protein